MHRCVCEWSANPSVLCCTQWEFWKLCFPVWQSMPLRFTVNLSETRTSLESSPTMASLSQTFASCRHHLGVLLWWFTELFQFHLLFVINSSPWCCIHSSLQLYKQTATLSCVPQPECLCLSGNAVHAKGLHHYLHLEQNIPKHKHSFKAIVTDTTMTSKLTQPNGEVKAELC